MSRGLSLRVEFELPPLAQVSFGLFHKDKLLSLYEECYVKGLHVSINLSNSE
jgi:hypothetical protein